MLTPGHLKAVGQDPSSDDRLTGAAGPVWVGDQLHHLTWVTLAFWIIRCHLKTDADRESDYLQQSEQQQALLFADGERTDVKVASFLIISTDWT